MPTTRSIKALPRTFISKEIVNERVTNYVTSKHGLLSDAIGKQDTRAAWYSLDQFEELVREMYYQNADGVRIYFGAYGNNDPLYANQLTVIFVPTHYDLSSGKSRDIIIDDTEDFAQRDISQNLDSVSLCPPTCDDDDDLTYPIESFGN